MTITENALDVARIRQVYDRSLGYLMDSGKRISPGWLNNLLSPIKGYHECVEQAYCLTEEIAAERLRLPFDG